LAGWFARSSRGVCLSRIVSPGPGAGTRLQSGAKKLCSSELIATKSIGLYKAC
jgi:hypothetical protein